MTKKFASMLLALLLAAAVFAPTTAFAAAPAAADDAVILVEEGAGFDIANYDPNASAFVSSPELVTKGFKTTWKFTVSGKKLSWKHMKFKSSKKAIVTVDKKGKITAKKFGKATLTATYVGPLNVRPKVIKKDIFVTTRKTVPYSCYVVGKTVHINQEHAGGTLNYLNTTLLKKKGIKLCKTCYGAASY